MNKTFIFTFLLVISAMSCKTHIESVTPEFPIEIYEFVCQQIGSQYISEICDSNKKNHSFVLRLQIKNNEIVDVAVLSKLLDVDITSRIEEALLHKRVSFSFIEEKSKNIHVSGLIKFKKLFKMCK